MYSAIQHDLYIGPGREALPHTLSRVAPVPRNDNEQRRLQLRH
jgi:hypothetical protein